MFDIGFWELAIIGVVALLVIGPERLPSVARTVGKWLGKTKQFVAYVQSDIKQELTKADELKQLLEKQTEIKEVHEIIEQTVSEAKKVVAVGARLDSHAVKSFDAAENSQSISDAQSDSESDSESNSDAGVHQFSNPSSNTSSNTSSDKKSAHTSSVAVKTAAEDAAFKHSASKQAELKKESDKNA